MGLSRSRTLFLIGLVVLVALSLDSSERVESFVDRAFGPLRFVGELALPFTWFSRSAVRAAEESALQVLDAERAESSALLRAAESASMPVDEKLRQGRGLVAAHVIERLKTRADELLVRFPPNAPVAVGSPVVCGDAFVGRVTSLDASHPGQGRVLLLTDKDFRVGACVQSGEKSGKIVVGGLSTNAVRGSRELLFAAQFPSDHSLDSGSVTVLDDEADGSAAGDATLANGFLLGTLVARKVRGQPTFAVKPALDFEHGLDHLAIVCPEQPTAAGPPLALDPFEDAAWTDVRFLLAGDPSPLRRTRTIAAGQRAGLRPGAALAIGARFLGRIERVSAVAADASLLGDPGLAFPALASVEGRAAPLALGRLVSLGVELESGATLFRWEAIVPLPDELGPLARAQLFTAAGESDLPPGLKIGRTTLPAGKGPFVLSVVPAQDARELVRVRAWRGLQERRSP